MPRLDGYPAADTLTGTEVTTAMQGGATKSVTTAQLAALAQAGLPPGGGAVVPSFDQDGSTGPTFSFDAE